jgi:CBS domain-containing protein
MAGDTNDLDGRRKNTMAKLARDVMTPNPACCTPTTTLDQVAKMMLQNDCGEIPVVDHEGVVIGVITDRDIVCRVVAAGKNPAATIVEQHMSQPIVTAGEDATLEEVLNTMEKHQLRRLPITDERGNCAGIIAQADVAWTGPERSVAELVREVSRDSRRAAP